MTERDPAAVVGSGSDPGQDRDPGRDSGPDADRDGGPAVGRDPAPDARRDAGADAGQDADRDQASASSGHASAPEGVIDLLGLLAYASLVAFFRLADDAALAASLPDKADLAAMAVTQFGHFGMLRDRIVELGADPEQAMGPFVDPIDSFHARTAPSDWLESLVKAYVGDGIAADFYRVVAQLLDQSTRSLVLTALADSGHAQFAIARVREAIAADPAVAGRLALWARRLVGEALSQAQRVAADRQSLARLLAGGSAAQLGEIGRMFAALTDAHAERMAALGLAD